MEGRTAVLPAHRPCAGAASSSCRAAPPLPLLPPRRRARRALPPAAALQPEHVEALSSSLGHLMTLAYEPVVLPCSALNCGDIVYRSTLDPVLRMEERGVNPQGLLLLAAAAWYMAQKPGVLAGAIDTYIKAPLQRRSAKVYAKEDFEMGRKLASGGFGTVYRAVLSDPDGVEAPRDVLVKKATEFGEAEAWMNERMMRWAPKSAAEFITAFSDGNAQFGDSTWLVWTYEGDYTLADLMVKKEFPYNLEQSLFGRELNIPKGPERKAAILRVAMQQLLDCLEKCHAVGIVHRDIKPQNCILSEQDQCIKLIDFGAAADLRIGLNYVPNQYLLDPRYAPPQQYIMSKQTPRAPPAPVAALLSPILWRLNVPDRFDMYSVGMLMLQMAFPTLRQDNTLVAFNKSLGERYGWDLNRWRAAMEARGDKAFTEGFAILDADNGTGWDLLCNLIRYEPRQRLSAAAALAHPWFGVVTPTAVISSTVASLGKVVSTVTESVDDGWLESRLAGNGTADRGGFTEAYLTEEGFTQEARKRENELPEQLANASNTIAWWQSRQAEVQDRLSKRRAAPSPKPADQGTGSSKKAGSGKVAAANGKLAAANGKAPAVNGKAPANGKAAAHKIAVLGKLAPLAPNGNGGGGSNGKAAAAAAAAVPVEDAPGSSVDEAEEGSKAAAAGSKKKAGNKGLQAVFELVGVGKK
ncbi:Serine threonine- kinase chloroplastic [Chlorella sorokiniana]|uniref:Serine threonine-kinase chloroplastic n=1 Tax=Chlorella sorokiniana TaxID=3076 RepID=A0A2P6TD00_CHLSO|nr:Serine threonine- kinase chloroplastic [Chlorella sorokiniana]|eukprot:PRW20521.1 Serine threonine- kinase chloroplastic [Chlorella sorokiniana]